MSPTLTFSLDFVSGMSPVRREANIELELRTASDEWVPVVFRVDTGASLTTMSLALSQPLSPTNPRGRNLRTALTPRSIRQTLADGSARTVTMQFGKLTARFPELRTFLFDWECLFDPTVSPERPPLLGIGGRVLTDLTLTFRGPSRDFPDGSFAIEIHARPVPLFPPSDPVVWETHYAPAGWPPIDVLPRPVSPPESPPAR